MLKSLLGDRVNVVWLLLMAATGLTWVLRHREGSVDDIHVATTLVMIVSFVKVRFVVLDFMELRHAPWFLRLLFEAWIVIVCGTILLIYFLGGDLRPR